MKLQKQQWPSTDALVYSVEWFDVSRGAPSGYNVVYSYKVGEDRFTGRFTDFTKQRSDYLHRDDTISVRFNPEHPQESLYPPAHSENIGQRALLTVMGLCALFLLIAFVVNALRHHH